MPHSKLPNFSNKPITVGTTQQLADGTRRTWTGTKWLVGSWDLVGTPKDDVDYYLISLVPSANPNDSPGTQVHGGDIFFLHDQTLAEGSNKKEHKGPIIGPPSTVFVPGAAEEDKVKVGRVQAQVILKSMQDILFAMPIYASPTLGDSYGSFYNLTRTFFKPFVYADIEYDSDKEAKKAFARNFHLRDTDTVPEFMKGCGLAQDPEFYLNHKWKPKYLVVYKDVEGGWFSAPGEGGIAGRYHGLTNTIVFNNSEMPAANDFDLYGIDTLVHEWAHSEVAHRTVQGLVATSDEEYEEEKLKIQFNPAVARTTLFGDYDRAFISDTATVRKSIEEITAYSLKFGWSKVYGAVGRRYSSKSWSSELFVRMKAAAAVGTYRTLKDLWPDYKLHMTPELIDFMNDNVFHVNIKQQNMTEGLQTFYQTLFGDEGGQKLSTAYFKINQVATLSIDNIEKPNPYISHW